MNMINRAPFDALLRVSLEVAEDFDSEADKEGPDWILHDDYRSMARARRFSAWELAETIVEATE